MLLVAALVAFVGSSGVFVAVALRRAVRNEATAVSSPLEIALDRFPILASFITLILTGYYSLLTARSSGKLSTWSLSAAKTCVPPAGASLLGAYGGDTQDIYKIELIETSSDLARQLFAQGLLHLHGYNYIEARRNFEAALAADKTCKMCAFGLAFTYSPHINGEMGASDGVFAHGILQSALRDDDGDDENKSIDSRRRKTIDLTRTLLKRFPSSEIEWEAVGGQAHYDDLLARELPLLASRYPDDADIKVLAAESIINTSPWRYYENLNLLPQMRVARSLLLESLSLHPHHPLALHLMIHLTEQSPEPTDGLSAANALRDLMTDKGNGHLVHMPSHTYYRIGDYSECLSSSLRAVHLNELFARSCLVPYFPQHNKALLVQCAVSAALLEPALQHSSPTGTEAVQFTMALSPYPRILVQVRFGLWTEVRRALNDDDVSTRLYDDDRGAYALSIYRYADALAAIGLGEGPQEVEQKLAALGRAAAAIPPRDASLRGLANVFYPYLGEIGQLFNATAHAAYLAQRGLPEAAAAVLREGVDIQDSFSYMEPEHHYSSLRQCYAAALLQSYEQTCTASEGTCRDGRRLQIAEEVVEVYLRDLALRPNNEWSLRGLQRALSVFNRTDVVLPRLHASSSSVELKGSCCELNFC